MNEAGGTGGGAALAPPGNAPADAWAPRLAPGVAVLEPMGPDAPWIIQDGPDRYFRVSPDFARLAASLDGATPLDDLARKLGDPWTDDDVRRTWDLLVAKELVGDRAPRAVAATSTFKYVPPLTFQLNVLDPSKVLAPFTRAIAVIMGRRGFAVQVAFALAGVAALALRPAQMWAAASTPLPLASYAVVALGFVLATAVHEFGHGMVLARHGGRPNRMGVMLFYLAPAFFCDVSDGWRLPHRWQRVQIACSGITTQAVVGATASFASLVPALHPWEQELLLFATGAYLGGILNLIPFVKFDGYLALMSHLDIPGLREKAMGDARQFGAWLLFGSRRDPELPQHRWAVAYGLACMVFPFVIVFQAVTLWSTALSQVGMVGLVGMLVGISGIAWVILRGWRRMVAFALGHGAPRIRVAAVSALAAAGIVALAVGVQVPRTVQGGYLTDEAGVVRFIVPRGAEGSLRVGDGVELYRSGVLGRQLIATGSVADATPTSRRGPISAVAPVVTDLSTTYPVTVRLAVDAPSAGRPVGPHVDNGIAIWRGPRVPLWRFAVDTYLKPLL